MILARSATEVMLQVVLEASLKTDVKRWVNIVVALSEGLSPLVGGLTFAWALYQGLLSIPSRARPFSLPPSLARSLVCDRLGPTCHDP